MVATFNTELRRFWALPDSLPLNALGVDESSLSCGCESMEARALPKSPPFKITGNSTDAC